jgi:fermentation-respiration switch protein FrsA (DUF1100 family)
MKLCTPHATIATMKRWLKIIAIIIGIIIVAFVGISAYQGYSLTKTHRVAVEGNPAQLGLIYENVSFYSTKDHLKLSGWLLPVDNSQRIIIMVHGEGNNRADPGIKMLDIAAGLVAHGYNVLMFDLRGHGESEGNRITGGYYEKRDVLGAVEYTKERGFQQIGVLGFSLGAVTSILAAGETNDIDAVVADSSYADLNDIMVPQFKQRTHAPVIFLKPILFMIKIMYGVDFSAIKPIEAIPHITPRPVFIIHGELAKTIPVAHAGRLKNASQSDNSLLWVAPGSGHCEAYKDYPQEYIGKVTAFLDKALK